MAGDEINWFWCCKTCGEDKPFGEFYLKNGWPKPYDCKICVKAKSKEWVANNRERYTARERARYHKDRPDVLRKTRQLDRRWTRLLTSAKKRAKSKSLDFDLDKCDIRARIAKGFCEVTGIPFVAGTHKSRAFSPSIDRIDSSKGYTKDNVRVVIWAINCICGEHGLDKAIELAKLADAKRNPIDSFTWCPC